MKKEEPTIPDFKTVPLNLKEFKEVWFLPPIRDIIKEEDKGDLAEIFHANTKMTPYSEQGVGIKTAHMVNDIMVEKRTAQGYKEYGVSIPVYQLPKSNEFKNLDANLFETITKRRSIRKYSNKKIETEDISKLLNYSYGISGEQELFQGTIQKIRVISSGGGLYPLEIYLFVFNAKDLPSGIYHYNVKNHSLELLKKGLDINEIIPLLSGFLPYQTREINLLVAVSAVFRRTTDKYGPRGYRYICFEIGTFMGHLQLVGEALGIGTVQIAGYYDNSFNDMLQLNGVDEAVMNLCALGYKKDDIK